MGVGLNWHFREDGHSVHLLEGEGGTVSLLNEYLATVRGKEGESQTSVYFLSQNHGMGRYPVLSYEKTSYAEAIGYGRT